ncbi:MAG: thioredoxin fold domain-containing protein [Thiobacillaceae bacterium]|nr:thioredoxin fold domain-containing protein [Thiobacillaceae bacterium]MDW8323926.1 thioredoxin fold domain-containing protein [Burkholderiales bacterium]
MKALVLRWQGVCLLAWILAWGLAHAAEGLPLARDLQQDAEQARARRAAVLIAFVSPNCPYCALALREVLVPTSLNPDYQDKLVMRRVYTREQLPLRDFAGRRTTHRDFSRQLGIFLVPTVVLFDPDGQPLAKPLVGITMVEQYGYDLDEAIAQAMARLRPPS